MPQLFTNNARALLASGIDNVATSLTVEAAKADLFPTANTGTGTVPSVNNWFKITLQDSSGNVEIMYVRTRTAGSAVMSNVVRGQEGTTARAFSAGTVVGLRITAADVEGSIAAANNSVQLTGNQTINGTKTFSQAIVAPAGVTGNVTGNAGSVTNGVYTTGNQTIGGNKIFTGHTIVTITSGAVGTAGAVGSFEIGQGVNNSAAAMSFHKAGYAINMGLDTDNVFRLGGWSMGLNVFRWTSDASGNFVATGNVTAFSDERLKKDWNEALPSARLVDALACVKAGAYTRIDNGERQVGVSAQSLQRILPEAVLEDAQGNLSVAYGNAAMLAVVALAREVVQLRERLAALEAK